MALYPLRRATRLLPDRFFVTRRGSSETWEITQLEYEAMALPDAGPPPNKSATLTARQWRTLWESGELVARGGCWQFDRPSTWLEPGDVSAEWPDQTTVWVPEYRTGWLQIPDAKVVNRTDTATMTTTEPVAGGRVVIGGGQATVL
jgi:hypothetical protein